MNFKFKKYWRKTGLNKKWGNILLELIEEKNPKHFLEIGVFCGVTSRNVCELLNRIHNGNFTFTGVDLFVENSITDIQEKKPEYILIQKFSNPFKHFYYNYILKENLNSKKSVEKFLRKFKNKIKLIQGDSNTVLKTIDLKQIDFAFIDGGHSYKTTYNDIEIIYNSMKNKNGTIVCDDYEDASYITDVKKAIDDFSRRNNLKLNVINGKFAVIYT